MDLKQGLICNITNEKADFEESCPDFKVDESVKEIKVESDTETEEEINHQEILDKLSPEIVESLKEEQNFLAGVIAGVIAALIGAVLWGVISVNFDYQIGYMAIGVGILVGFSVGKFGKGIELKFGIFGAAISFLGVAFGNIFSVIGYLSVLLDMSIVDAFMMMDFNYIIELFIETFSPIDLLFYGIAIYAGFKYSFRKDLNPTLQPIKENR